MTDFTLLLDFFKCMQFNEDKEKGPKIKCTKGTESNKRKI